MNDVTFSYDPQLVPEDQAWHALNNAPTSLPEIIVLVTNGKAQAFAVFDDNEQDAFRVHYVGLTYNSDLGVDDAQAALFAELSKDAHAAGCEKLIWQGRCVFRLPPRRCRVLIVRPPTFELALLAYIATLPQERWVQ